MAQGLTEFRADNDALHCDYCTTVESAADLTPDWNGETGNHVSCERRRWTRGDGGQIMFDGEPLFLVMRARWGDGATPAAIIDGLERQIIAMPNAADIRP